jgi:hypothetical protein
MGTKLTLRFAWLLAVATLLLSQACKKGEDPTPASLADQVAGNYSATRVELDNGVTITAPSQTYSATLTLTKISDTEVKAVTRETINGTTEDNEFDIDLTQASGGSIEMTVDGDKVGTYQSNTVTFDYTEFVGTKFVFTFVRR